MLISKITSIRKPDKSKKKKVETFEKVCQSVMYCSVCVLGGGGGGSFSLFKFFFIILFHSMVKS